MTPPDQIKVIAADFLRALATVPGLFTRWQAETSPAVRAGIVRTELGIAQNLTAGDIVQMAAFTEPHARRTTNASLLPDVPQGIIVAHAAMEGVPA